MILGHYVPVFVVESVDIKEQRQAIPVLQTESTNILKLLLVYRTVWNFLYKNSNQSRKEGRKTPQIKSRMIFKDPLPRFIPQKRDEILQNSYEENFIFKLQFGWETEGENKIFCFTL